MTFDYLTRRENAVRFLASELGHGTLVLFLGAGATLSAGLPDWIRLMQRMQRRVGLPVGSWPDDVPAETLQIAADAIRERFPEDGEAYRRLVCDSLYEGVSLSPAILRNDLLTAVGALLMGTRRGNVRRVLTFNFDCVLEWYLFLFGFVVRVVYRLPELEGAEDVRVYHAHGFLPHPEYDAPESDFLILDFTSVNARLGTLGDPWFEETRRLLQTGVGLFVGLSPRTLRDRALNPLLAAVAPQLETTRPTGFWVVTGAASVEEDREFLRANVVPVRVGSDGDVPKLLLDVCQAAAIRSVGV